MDINYLIQLLGNRLNGLILSKDQAFSSGDLERINSIDSEILSVQNTLSKLNLIINVEQTAASTSFTEAEVVQNGIDVSLEGSKSNEINNIENPTGILLEYDISSYATDPLHEEKIADILGYIGEMNMPQAIDDYIDSEAISSPITGVMVYNSAQKYNVDTRLMMALMELDSRFGTVGIAISTKNPGNIGNNDEGETRTYSSWEDGVDAVANWLNNHRVIEEIEEIKEEEISNINIIEETVDTTTEIDENGDEIITTTTTTIEEIDLPEDTIINAEDPVVENETVSTLRRNKKRV